MMWRRGVLEGGGSWAEVCQQGVSQVVMQPAATAAIITQVPFIGRSPDVTCVTNDGSVLFCPVSFTSVERPRKASDEIYSDT
jgi:hypothetical protein